MRPRERVILTYPHPEAGRRGTLTARRASGTWTVLLDRGGTVEARPHLLELDPFAPPPPRDTTREFWGSIRLGRGTPWPRLALTDDAGAETIAEHLGVTERGPDGEFYPWAWEGTRLRIVSPPRLLPYSMQARRTKLMGRTIDGRWVGPFRVAPAERFEVSYMHGGIEPTEQQRRAVVDAVVAELTD